MMRKKHITIHTIYNTQERHRRAIKHLETGTGGQPGNKAIK